MKSLARFVFTPRVNLFDIFVLNGVALLVAHYDNWWLFLLYIPAAYVSFSIEDALRGGNT